MLTFVHFNGFVLLTAIDTVGIKLDNPLPLPSTRQHLS